MKPRIVPSYFQADLGLPPQSHGTPAGVPDAVRSTLQQAGLGALSDGAVWASGGRRPWTACWRRWALLARRSCGSWRRRGTPLTTPTKTRPNIAALGGVEGLHAAVVANGDRGGENGKHLIDRMRRFPKWPTVRFSDGCVSSTHKSL